jgi:hypothetical protein
MRKSSDHLSVLQEQMTVRKTLLEHGKIRLIPEKSEPRPMQKGEESNENDKQLPLIPVTRR